LFDHYITIEQATAAAQGGSSNTTAGSSSNGTGSKQQHSSWAHTPNHSGSNSSSNGSVMPFIPDGSSLMHPHTVGSSNGSSNHHDQQQQQQHELNDASSGSLPAVPGVVCAAGQQQRHDVLQQLSGHSDVEGVLSMVLEYGQQLLQIRANDWSALEAEGGTGRVG
jgi:hypothetical protein